MNVAGIKRVCASVAGLLASTLLSLSVVGAAHAADSIYWANEGTGKLSHANLAGGGGADVPIAGATVTNPFGLAIDSAAGRIYWTNVGDNAISFANIDGSGGAPLNTTGAPVKQPEGLAIDPRAGRIYWANRADNTIGFANLNGSGGGPLNTTGAAIMEPVGVAIDRATGRIYWANLGTSTIGFANLDGSGKGGALAIADTFVNGPEGVAIDATANRIYWGNNDDDTIGFANLDGSGGALLATTGAPVSEPTGLAIDHSAGRIYWANYGNNTIASVSLDGRGGAPFVTAGASTGFPLFPVLLKTPLGVQPPVASPLAQPFPRTARRVASASTTLSCSQGTWAPDLIESFLYRAPQSFSYQWLRDGKPVAEATAVTVKALKVGKYTCQVTATNFAGSTSQTSAPVAIAATLKIGKARVNRRTGTGILPITVTGTGKVTVAGKGLATRRRSRTTGAVKLALIATGRAKKNLVARGKLRVKAVVTYTPDGGETLRRKVAFVLTRR